MDHYALMRKEIVSLWKILRQKSIRNSEIDQKISIIDNLAVHIGGKVRDDAEQLKRDIYQFLHGKMDPSSIDRMFHDALKLEQETREL
jgi:hypothetical protein